MKLSRVKGAGIGHPGWGFNGASSTAWLLKNCRFKLHQLPRMIIGGRK